MYNTVMGSTCSKITDMSPKPQRAKYKLPLLPDKKKNRSYQTFVDVPEGEVPPYPLRISKSLP